MASDINRDLARQVNAIVNRIEHFSHVMEGESKKMMNKAAGVVVKKARQKAPTGKKPHTRYNKKGEKIATYYPGNLKKSIKVLRKLRRARNLWVGPESGLKVKNDGYYAHMVEYGTVNFPAKPFMRPAYEESKPEVVKIITNGVNDVIKKYGKK